MQQFAAGFVFYTSHIQKDKAMKKYMILTVLLSALIITAASAQSSGKETRNLKGFTRVNFGVSGNLYIHLGKEFNVTLEGDEDDLKEIITEVSNGKLSIRRDNHFFEFNNEKVTINITMPEITGLGVSGSGRAEITDPVTEADRIELSVSGSGKISVPDLTADNLECSISGSGNINIGKGSADKGEITISGSGNYTGQSMEIDHLNVRVSGSGNCTCLAGDELTASVSGSGNVWYSGNPQVDARVSGSGKVRSK